MEDIRAWTVSFCSLNFSFLKHVWNKAANALAKKAVSSISD